MRLSILILLSFVCSLSWAEVTVVEFPEEELETETVLPYFPIRAAVKDRNVKLAKKIEVGFGLGTALNEPIFNPFLYSLSGTYHLDELQGINITYYGLSGSLSANGKNLERAAVPYFADRSPAATSVIMSNYEYKAFYGKMSLTKKVVFNTSIYGSAGLGLIKFGDESEILLNLGVGQKVFLTTDWAVKLDLNVWLYQGPDITSVNLKVDGSPVPANQFAKRLYVNQALTAGLVKTF